MIAQILAARYPDKVEKLGILFSSNNQRFLPPPYPKQLFRLISRPEDHKEETLVQHSLKLFYSIGSPGHIDPKMAAEVARKLYQRSFYPAGSVQQFLAILCTGSLLEVDRKIRQPTLVVHGSEDRLLPPAHGRAVAKAIRGARFELIEGMGHDIVPYFIDTLVEQFGRHFSSHAPMMRQTG